MSSSNLPPGVTESMIPGNTPEDHEWESMAETIGKIADDNSLTPTDILDIVAMGLGAWKAVGFLLRDQRVLRQDISFGHLRRVNDDEPKVVE